MAKRKADGPLMSSETVQLDSLKAHPRNYRNHPPEQLRHIEASLQVNGFYRPLVVARDGTILAGHGVATAAHSLGYKEVPIIRLDVEPDSPVALRVLTGDNEISRLAMPDDRLLTELLRELVDTDDGLAGTGYDEEKLAALLMVTRTAAEIADFDAAAEWVGMPDFDLGTQTKKLIVQFASDEDRERFVETNGIQPQSRGAVWTGWWPHREDEDLRSIAWVEEEADA